MNKKKMSIWQKGFYVISFIILIWAFIYLGTKNYNVIKHDISDAEAFTKDFGISSNNVFKYKTAKEVLEALNSKTAIIFMAFPENKWSSYYADLLNDIAIEEGVKEIYFYNFYNDRKNNNHYYENIVDRLSNYISILDDETKNIYAPTLVIVKNGEITFFDNETSIMSGEYTTKEYWNNERKNKKKIDLRSAIKEYQRIYL